MKQLILREVIQGVVSEVIGDEAVITYETPDGPLRQLYARRQFLNGALPAEGYAVECEVNICYVQRQERVIESDIPSFEGRGIKGQLRI